MNQFACVIFAGPSDSTSYVGRLFAADNLPNLILCVIGIAGVFAALRTLEVVRRQTDATQKSVTLQEAAMKQWVVLQNWTYSKREDADGSKLLSINFDIVNPTDWRMTLLTTKLRIKQRESMSRHSVVLAPNTPYRMIIPNLTVTDEKEPERGFVFVLFGAVDYLDCFEKQQSQIFGGLVRCAADGQTTFRMEWYPNNPYGEQKDAVPT